MGEVHIAMKIINNVQTLTTKQTYYQTFDER